MATLRRELITRFMDIIRREDVEINTHDGQSHLSKLLADSACVLRAFQDTADQEYKSIAESWDERQEELRDDISEKSLEAAIILGKPLGKAAQKIRDSLELHAMICAELARLPYNFEGDLEKEQESFRKFLKEKRKLGQELSTWVNWWMSDEWRVANPPWRLTVIKVKWLEAFPPEPKIRTESSGHYA